MKLNFFDPEHPFFPVRWLLIPGFGLVVYLLFIDLNHRTFFGAGDDREAVASGPSVQGFHHK